MDDELTTDASFFETRDALTRFLFLKDDPAAVDLCFVLGSPTAYSMQPAIDLYLGGLTEQAIFLERQASNTLENFVFSRVVIEREIGWDNIRAVAMVSKPFHMRRALMAARKQWPAHVKFVMQPSTDPRDIPADTWWQSEEGRRYVLSELKAIGNYALQNHIGGY